MSSKAEKLVIEGTASYPQLFIAKNKTRDDGTVDQEFGIEIILDRGSPFVEPLRALAMAAATAEWGHNTAMWPKFKHKAVRDCTDKLFDQSGKEREGYRDKDHFISCTTKIRPVVVDANCQKIIDPTVLYGGCRVAVNVHAYTYKFKGNCGVKFGFNAVQKIGEGKPFGGGPPDASQIFKPLNKSGTVMAPSAATGSGPVL